jgi:hypothetical protein
MATTAADASNNSTFFQKWGLGWLEEAESSTFLQKWRLDGDDGGGCKQ